MLMKSQTCLLIAPQLNATTLVDSSGDTVIYDITERPPKTKHQ